MIKCEYIHCQILAVAFLFDLLVNVPRGHGKYDILRSDASMLRRAIIRPVWLDIPCYMFLD